LGWGAPELLGLEVNTADDENAPTFVQNDLYFTRGNNALGQQNLYVAPAKRVGEVEGPVVYLSELNHPTANDAAPTVRADGREIFFQRSAQAGGLGGADFWTSTRQSASGPWSSPVTVEVLNTADFEQQASLSRDGRMLVWASNRPGGSGGFDIWTATRAPLQN
jgi:WD40 repeat protein